MTESVSAKAAFSGRTVALFICLVILAGLGNYWRIPLFYGADFVFGSIFVLLALYRLGLAAGVAAAVIAHSYTLVLWSHPYSFLIFLAETLFVGVGLSRGYGNLVLLDALFWLTAGMPLGWLCHGVVMDMDGITTVFVMLQQAVNGVFNALVASLIVHHLVFATRRDAPGPEPPRRLQDTLFNLLASLVLIPALVIMLMESNREVGQMEKTLLINLDRQAADVSGHVHSWYHRHLQALEGLAALARHSLPARLLRVQEAAEVLDEAFPDFHGVFVADAQGTAVAFSPLVDERGERTVGKNFADRAYFGKLQATGKPVLSEVILGRGSVYAPLVTLGVPILIDGRFQGFALGGLNLTQIRRLLDCRCLENATPMTLVDQNGRVITSTFEAWEPLRQWDRHLTGQKKPVQAGIYHWMPAASGLPSLIRWKKSYYIKEMQIDEDIPWKLIVEAPVAPLQDQLFVLYVRKLAVMAVLTALALAAALVFSRQLVRPLVSLAEVTTGLPAKLMMRRPITWPPSTIAEVNALIGNIQSMCQSLEQTFADLETHSTALLRANAELNAEVRERRKAQMALGESEARYRNLVEQTPAVTYIAAVDQMGTRTIYVSPQIRSILEVTPEKFTDEPRLWDKSLHPDDRARFLKERERCLKTGQVFEMEYRVLTASGREVWVHDQNTLVMEQDGAGRVLQGFLFDITARKKSEEEKDRLEVQLRQAQKMEAIGTLAGGIAHDFNNILGAIFGCVELALKERYNHRKLVSHLEETLKAAERARELVRQILTFSRQSEPQQKPVHLDVIIRESMNLVRASLPATIEIRQHIRGFGLIFGDPTQIQQIIMNLCSNAGHAMREKGGVLMVSLEDVNLGSQDLTDDVELPSGPYVRLTVKDTGCGMDEATLERIFDPYFTTKGAREGTGLGLALVHGIVKSMGGAVKVEAAPGQGSTFQVYLPRLTTPQISGLEPPPAAAGPEESLGLHERILFVDDEEVLVRMGSRLLKSLGYEVTATTSSLEALKLFHENPDTFDLVITDQTMPQMTGDQLAKEIMEIRQGMPVILCTGFSELISEEGAKELGIREFLMKPIRMNDLARIIRRVLDRMRR
jgi:PAS domain S-box-containing protein